MKKLALVLIFLVVSACSMLPGKEADRREWKSVSCGGADSWHSCYQKAGADCPGGFDIANQEESHIRGVRTFQYACRSK